MGNGGLLGGQGNGRGRRKGRYWVSIRIRENKKNKKKEEDFFFFCLQWGFRYFFVKACCSDFSKYRFRGKGVKIQEHFQRLGIYGPGAERKFGQMISLFNRDQR